MSSNPTGTLMVVDDTPENLHLLESILVACGHRVLAFTNGRAALSALDRVTPDMAILDISMPELDGYQVCAAIKRVSRLSDMPVLFSSARSDIDAITRAFIMGGVDYITKPFQLEEVKARVNAHLRIKTMKDELVSYTKYLEDMVVEKTRENVRAHISTIEALAQITEYRDKTTGNHIRRIQSICKELSISLQSFPKFSNAIDDDFLDNIFNASSLHDIGKVMIPDAVLLKPSTLTLEEFSEVQKHAELGARVLEKALHTSPSNDLLTMGITIARYHHERWNGQGYPQNLSGYHIPLPARIMALVDVYDAVRSERPYKQSCSHEVAMNIIKEGAGVDFDPDIVEAFVMIEQYVINLDYRCPIGEVL